MATNKFEVFEAHRMHPTWAASDIARHLNCLRSYVATTAKRYGLRLPKHPRGRAQRTLQDWERQAIIDAYRDGEKIEAVAAEFGVTVSCVTKAARRAGEPPRPPRGIRRQLENTDANSISS